MDIALKGDLIAWRKLLKDVRKPFSSDLQKFRVTKEKNRLNNDNELPEFVYEAVVVCERLFIIALAGVQSGLDNFNDQKSDSEGSSKPHTGHRLMILRIKK